MRSFVLVRYEDETGISGTGIVAEGVEFTDGTTVMRWLERGTSRPDVVRPTTVVHESVESVIALHGHGGRTVVKWVTPPRGWEQFGTHANCRPQGIEFSEDQGDDGLPLWERLT